MYYRPIAMIQVVTRPSSYLKTIGQIARIVHRVIRRAAKDNHWPQDTILLCANELILDHILHTAIDTGRIDKRA